MRFLVWVLPVLLLEACGTEAPSPPPANRPAFLEPAPGVLTLPKKNGSIRFAVIGDSGRGSREQYEVGGRLADIRQQFRFEFVLMLGDNIYEGPIGPRDYELRFERPYRRLLDAGVKFYASLGNHDDPRQRDYPLFNMNGHRYYTFEVEEHGIKQLLDRRVRFFALDTNYTDREQLRWLENELSKSSADWNICFFHHPPYSSGRYGSWWLRRALEPIFVNHHVDVVFSGHEHFYERLRPQNGVHYFISGGAGSVRRDDISEDGLLERGYDQDLHFMLVEISGDMFHFQSIDRLGKTIDHGSIERQGE